MALGPGCPSPKSLGEDSQEGYGLAAQSQSYLALIPGPEVNSAEEFASPSACFLLSASD